MVFDRLVSEEELIPFVISPFRSWVFIRGRRHAGSSRPLAAVTDMVDARENLEVLEQTALEKCRNEAACREFCNLVSRPC